MMDDEDVEVDEFEGGFLMNVACGIYAALYLMGMFALDSIVAVMKFAACAILTVSVMCICALPIVYFLKYTGVL